MPKPACVRCQCFYRPKKNSVDIVEGMPVPLNGENQRNEDIRGRRRPHAWRPYKLWAADLWECPDCGHELIAGWSHRPRAIQHEPTFKAEVANARARGWTFDVNDC